MTPEIATHIGPSAPDDGREWDCNCARCGSSTERVSCNDCGGEGYIDVYEDDPINNDPDDTEVCGTCHGRGGWLVCLADGAWCEAHPLPGRIHERGVIEWFVVLRSPKENS